MSTLTKTPVTVSTPSPTRVIETIAETTVEACRQAFGQRLAQVILTGSLARKEATLIECSSGCRLLGDAEFLLIFRRGFALPSRGGIDALGIAIAGQLERQAIFCPVHFAAVRPSYLRRLPRHIFSYELRTNGRVIYGDKRILGLIPEFSPNTIEREDAWRMLSNRTIEWLENLAEVPDGQEEPGTELFYSSVKLVLDAATSLLVFLEAYEPTYRARAKRLEELAREEHETPAQLHMPLDQFASLVAMATRWKCSPDLAMSACNRWAFCRAARDCTCQLWSWELGQIAALHPALPPFELIRQWGWDLAVARRWRGWLYAARELGWRKSLAHWLHWCALARYGAPRHWIYAIAMECTCRNQIFSPGQPRAAASALLLSKLRPFLPIEWPNGKRGQGDWRKLVRDLAWNYHEFVEQTRA